MRMRPEAFRDTLFLPSFVREPKVNRLFAFWGVGVVLAWGRGLPDD